MEKFKITADSSADLTDLADVSFASAPLKIVTNEREFTDDAALDVKEMVDYLSSLKARSSTSCPSPEDWLQAFGDASYVFCLTITSVLSGSYNSAMAAKGLYEGMYPDRRVFVLDSLSTGPEMRLMAEKIASLIAEGKEFDAICRELKEYRRHTGLVFMLESMKNLANNGRVSPLVARAAGLLGIRAVGKAGDEGDLQLVDKCRGMDRALQVIVKTMRELGCRGGKVFISHCFNEEAAQKLRDLLSSELTRIQVEIYRCRGLCSYYAEKGGLLVGFETC